MASRKQPQKSKSWSAVKASSSHVHNASCHDMNDLQIFSCCITLSCSIQQISNPQYLTLATSLDDSPPINVRNIAVGAHLNSIMRSDHRNCLLMLGK
jgi:hypothetical protein